MGYERAGAHPVRDMACMQFGAMEAGIASWQAHAARQVMTRGGAQQLLAGPVWRRQLLPRRRLQLQQQAGLVHLRRPAPRAARPAPPQRNCSGPVI